MERATVELRVGGQIYRVVGSASPDELQRLARVVDGKLRELSGGGSAFHPQSMLLVAMSLAHELEQERARRKDVELRSKEMLRTLLDRVDGALELVDGDAQELTPEPASVVPAPPSISPEL
jgi:cell division protein ZapA